MPSIPVFEPKVYPGAHTRVQQALQRGWLSSAAPVVADFEAAFAKLAGVPYAVACSSGTNAVHLALAATGVQSGDEVILPDFTMMGSVFPVLALGAIPRFVDVDPRHYTIGPEAVAAAITSRTRAIVAVHIYGHSADMGPLRALADRHDLTLIEDAAEAHGCSYRGRPCGSLGNAAAFSFYGNKLITTGEGGMVTTHSLALANKLRALRNMSHRKGERFVHDDIGYSFRMGALQAALGLGQLDHFEEIRAHRSWLTQAYAEALADIPGLILPHVAPWAQSLCWMFAIRVTAPFPLTRNQLAHALQARGIETRPFFPSCARQPVMQRILGVQAPNPVSERIGSEGLYLPSGLTLTQSDVEQVARAVRDAAR